MKIYWNRSLSITNALRRATLCLFFQSSFHPQPSPSIKWFSLFLIIPSWLRPFQSRSPMYSASSFLHLYWDVCWSLITHFLMSPVGIGTGGILISLLGPKKKFLSCSKVHHCQWYVRWLNNKSKSKISRHLFHGSRVFLSSFMTSSAVCQFRVMLSWFVVVSRAFSTCLFS